MPLRISSSDPNLQNIPIRTQEEGKSEAFIAKDGYSLISADYSQIELRLVAHVAGEQSMLTAFQQDIDIHSQTASEVFGVPLAIWMARQDEKPRPLILASSMAFRDLVWRVNYLFLAAKHKTISKPIARFPGIQSYMEETKAKAREDKFVETFGRRIYIGDIAATNPAMRQFAERQAINAPIQGGAADIVKRAMIAMRRRLLIPVLI